MGIKKTDLEFEDKYEKMSVVFFRIDEVFNLKNKEDEKRDFELQAESFKREKIAELKILKCVFLDRFTFLDYIQAGCEVSTIIGMDFTLSNKK